MTAFVFYHFNMLFARHFKPHETAILEWLSFKRTWLKMKCDIQVRQLGTRIAYRYSCLEGRLHQAATNRNKSTPGKTITRISTHGFCFPPTLSQESLRWQCKWIWRLHSLWIFHRSLIYKYDFGERPFIHLHSALTIAAEGTFEKLTSLYQITSPRITEDTAYETGTVSVTKTIIKVVSSHTCVNSF